MISRKMQDAINKQIVAELWSGYIYLSMAAYFDSMSLKGFAGWMRNQAMEEQVHAMKFYNYVNDRGGKVKLGAIEAPPTAWKSPQDAFQYGLKHEGKVTALINNLVDLAAKEKDHASSSFLQWYVDEQVEEEASFGGIVDKLRLVAGTKNGLFMIDKEMAARTFVYPPPALGAGA